MKIKFKAFTLAEIMIVLSVIAILTVILLPTAKNAMPNEDVVKFKKTHNAIATAIREIVNSDKYFLDGDIRVLPNGNCPESRLAYALADILNSAQVIEAGSNGGSSICSVEDNFEILNEETFEKMKTYMDNLDTSLKDSPYKILRTILASYSAHGVIKLSDLEYIFTAICTLNNDYYCIMYANGYDVAEDGVFDIRDAAKILGILNGSSEGKFNTFTYAVRYDGKIITSSKVDEWLNKSIQDKD